MRRIYHDTDALKSLIPDSCWGCPADENGDFLYENIDWQDERDMPARDLVIAEKDRLNAAEPMRYLREVRDELLAETDWMASSDRTMTAEQTAYRQALRDLPANTTDPENPVWPTKP